MPPSSPRKPISRTQALIAGLALWLLLATAWTAWLLSASHNRFLDQSLLTRTQTLASLLQSSPPPAAQQTLDSALRLDPAAVYAMIWSEDGRVILHTQSSQIGTYLDEKQWPALEPQQPYRISQLSLPPPAPHPRVLEATIPLPPSTPPSTQSASRPRQFLTLALARDPLAAQFWQASRGLILAAALLTLAGALLLATGILLTFRRLERSQREIEQNARARTSLLTERGMLASVLAHEVRSPLTALRFNLHTLRSLIDSPTAVQPADQPSATSTEKQLDLTDRCEREIHRLDRMLNDFLLRTQLAAPPDSAPAASVNAVVRQAIEFLTPALDRQHIHVSLHLDPAEPHVAIQPDELRQVILNLAANAQDAMPAPKGGTLAISTVSPPPNSPSTSADPTAPETRVSLLIRDSGIGIPPELHQRIFEPFFSTKPNGSGLGLALVRRVVSGAGGTVFCESTPNQGTTFRLLLPSSAHPTPQPPTPNSPAN